MRSPFILSLLSGALATRPFVNEVDTGFDDFFADVPTGELAPLDKLVGLPDFDAAARRYLPIQNYTFLRNAAAGEWSYRNNLEVYSRYRLRPRMMVDITNVNETLPTTILGYNFSAPFFICPCGDQVRSNAEAEKGLVEAAGAENILYIPSGAATLSMEEIASYKQEGQVLFQQVYLDTNDTKTQDIFDRAKALGTKAFAFTVDSAADGNRQRGARYGVPSADGGWTYITWDFYHHLKTLTPLPIVIKGIQTVEDAQEAVRQGADGIYLSNHGGRQVDGSPSSLEVALEIHEQAPELFSQIEVFADGGVRYGTDVIKLLALGIKAVGLGRAFMYANVYGGEGVARAIRLLKREVAIDAGNAGIADLGRVDPSFVKWEPAWTT
ncbi:putative cytochrome b2 protein [Eutypa lata UCREL1]|uniref:Putative cytochrome b2 protein n=1 Tax=Eutypa lata (strain UCR-EL1) TaxID=1287681 RepID=M7SX03_EUTLA|nr:putative cytochrome b2 protein [Eutypa lata UCREL1]